MSQVTSKTLDTTGIVLLALTLISWFILAVNLMSIVGKEAHGDASMGKALNAIAALVFAAATWLLLGILLLRAASQDVLPMWSSVVATILFFISGPAAITSIFLVDDPEISWPAAVPITIPLLISIYVFGLYARSLNPTMSTIGAGVIVWGLVLALSIAPWPEMIRSGKEKERKRIEHAKLLEQSRAVDVQRGRDERLARIREMAQKKWPIWDWYSLVEKDSGVKAEAIREMRMLEKRQSQMELVLEGGAVFPMGLVPDLDLQATPALCGAALIWCKKTASDIRREPGQEPSATESHEYLAPALPGLRWLKKNGCQIDEGLKLLEDSVKTFRDTPHRKAVLETLGELTSSPPHP